MSKKKETLKSDKNVTNPIIDENVKQDKDIDNVQPVLEMDDVSTANDESKGEDVSIEETVIKQSKEIENLKDQLLRSLAESENLRKRTIKEITDAKKYSHISFVRDLISSVDNLQRALAAVPENKSELSEPIKNLIIGLEIIEKEIINTFEKHNISQISPVGEKFDYNLHQAMFEVPTNEKDPGYIVEVSQKGYLLNDRLVRPAMVGISKKPEEKTLENNNKEE